MARAGITEGIVRSGPQAAWRLGALVLAGLLLAACATPAAPAGSQASTSAAPAARGGAADRAGRQVLATLGSLAGRPYNAPATVAGRAWRLDCIGLVTAVYWSAGIDLAKAMAGKAGNGVTRLWTALEEQGLRDSRSWPRAGDIVFWDNTWDANGDGRFGNDGHTHAGVVSRVEADGTVWYWHASVSRGVVEAFMNLKTPSLLKDAQGKPVNSPMYLGAAAGKKTNPPRWLSGELYSGRGDLPGMLRLFGVAP